MTQNLRLDGCLKRPYKTKAAAKTALAELREQRAIEAQMWPDMPTRTLPTRVYGPCSHGNYHLTSMALYEGKTPEQGRVDAMKNTVRRRENDQCARCGVESVEKLSNRGGGREGSGRTDISHHLRPSNFFLTCLPCYNTLHRTSVGRSEGWFLAKHENPSTYPLLYRGVWATLDDKGGIKPREDNA